MTVNPAREELGQLRMLMRHAPPERRAAIYAIDLGRVQAVSEQFFGNSLPLLLGARLLQAFAQGLPLDREACELVRERAEAAIGALYASDELGYPMCVARLASAVMFDLAPRDWCEPEHAVEHLIELADVLDGEPALLAEARWQHQMVQEVLRSESILDVIGVRATVTAPWMAGFRIKHPRPIGFTW